MHDIYASHKCQHNLIFSTIKNRAI